MYDYENSREAAGLENIGWKLNPHKRVMLQLNDEDLELKKNDIYKKLLSNLGHYEWEEWTSHVGCCYPKCQGYWSKTGRDYFSLPM